MKKGYKWLLISLPMIIKWRENVLLFNGSIVILFVGNYEIKKLEAYLIYQYIDPNGLFKFHIQLLLLQR